MRTRWRRLRQNKLPRSKKGAVIADSAFCNAYGLSLSVVIAEAALDQLYQSLNSSLLIRAVSNDADVSAANNTQRKDTQKALSVYSPIFAM